MVKSQMKIRNMLLGTGRNAKCGRYACFLLAAYSKVREERDKLGHKL